MCLCIQTRYLHLRRFRFSYQQSVDDVGLYSFLSQFTHISPSIVHHMQLLKLSQNVLTVRKD